jgi:hypothetical protein
MNRVGSFCAEAFELELARDPHRALRDSNAELD